MKKKIIIPAIIILIVVIIVCSYLFIKGSNEEEINIITPEEEISDEQMRQTIVSLYFLNEETGELVSEGRLIDAKELLENPYDKLMELLIEGPENSNLSKTIPEGTKINSIELKGEILYIDLSKEFVENHEGGKEKESATIYSIVNTMTNFTEVNGIKILIDGNQDMAFSDNLIKFDDPFVRIDENDNTTEEENIIKDVENNLNDVDN